MEQILDKINSIVWGPPLLILLFGTHLFLTFKLGFIQKYILKAIKLSFMKEKKREVGDISHFAALTTALAATIGTGNIIGVSTAIAVGGPGAVFWMWLTGIFGIATKYSEALLSIKYRVKKNNHMVGGPMYTIEHGMNAKWLAILFALFTVIASFGIGNMVQSNSIAILSKETFNISPWITGIILSILTSITILGGIKSISNTCGFLVPFMAIFYIVGCIIIIIMRFETIPATIIKILTSAFTGQAAIGGFIGATIKEAMRYGIARGLFSNESGMGSAPIGCCCGKNKFAS